MCVKIKTIDNKCEIVYYIIKELGLVYVRELRNLFYIFVIVIFSTFISDLEIVKAVEYTYVYGVVEEKVDNKKVLDFSYDYISVFSESSGYYKGQEVLDSKNSLKDVNFYSGKSIVVNVNHIDKLIGKDDDRVTIYKYSEVNNNFNTVVFQYINEDAVKEITMEGLYKIEYKFFDKEEVVRVNYICVTSHVHAGEVSANRDYSSTSAFIKFEAKMSFEDVYDLKKNRYYYAFGESEENLSYTQFDLFTVEEMSDNNPVVKVTKVVTLDILDNHQTLDLQRKRLFVKIEKIENMVLTSDVFCSQDGYSLIKNVKAYVNFLDENGNKIEEEKVYKKDQIIRGEILFNAPVEFTDLKISLNNGENFIELGSSAEAITKIDFEYVVDAFNDSSNGVKIVTEDNDFAIVENEGNQVELLDAVLLVNYSIDVSAPTVEIISEDLDETYKNTYDIFVNVFDGSLSSIEYYVDTCRVVQGNECKEAFNSSNKGIIRAVREDFEDYLVDGLLELTISLTQENAGKRNGENLAIYFRAEDMSGNQMIAVKYGFLLDNVIVEEEDSVFLEEPIEENGNIVGKKLYLVFNQIDKVTSVKLLNQTLSECIVVGGTDSTKKYFECFSHKGGYYSDSLIFQITDEYGNEEEISSLFVYSNLVEGIVSIDNYQFTVYNNKFYDAETFDVKNIMKGNNVVLNKSFFNEIEKMLKLDEVVGISELSKRLVMIGKEEVIVVNDDLQGLVQLPTIVELLEYMKQVEGYNKCEFKGQTCDMYLYIEYGYNVNDRVQFRYVKLNFNDQWLKFEIENFGNEINVGINDTFEGVGYKVYDSLNVEVKENLDVIREIYFVDKNGIRAPVSTIDTSRIGKYEVVEIVNNSSSSTFPLNYVVKVTDTIKPIISLINSDKLVINKGKGLGDILNWVKVSDNYDQNVEIKFKWDKEFDKNKPGTYVVSFWAVDDDGNVSNIVSRSIVVKEIDINTYLIIGIIVLLVLIIMVIFARKEFGGRKKLKS